jgi:N-acetylglucosaminyldiphosphoundecaprenol N-acetyl-beta-D-mannosaminyltransferase
MVENQEILGVKIDRIDLKGAVDKVAELVGSDKQGYVTTVNPEFLVAADSNSQFKQVLNKASLAICDGIGIVLASGGKLIRVTGVELSSALLADKRFKIFVLGGSAKNLPEKNQGNIVGSAEGGEVDEQNWLLSDNSSIINQVNGSGANVLLVGFGQVKQEMWIYNNLSKMPGVKVAIGVGGTFDYLSGKVKRAPKLVRVLGLEWLFRLLTQPRRIGRIFNATFKFLWLVAFKK